MLRFLIAPKRRQFLVESHNFYDVMAILPFWFNQVFELEQFARVGEGDPVTGVGSFSLFSILGTYLHIDIAVYYV